MTGLSRGSLTDVLRDAIRTSGRRAYAVSQVSGVAQPILSRFLRGERGITLETADKLCKTLRLELRPIEEGQVQAAPGSLQSPFATGTFPYE
jgi:hypothetical protein